MINEFLANGFYVTNYKFNSPFEWIEYFKDIINIRQYNNFWSMLPNSDDKVMLISTQKLNNKICLASRSTPLNWHYDGIGMTDREDVIGLYCIIPNSVTSILNLKSLYETASKEIKEIIHKTVIELELFNDNIYQLTPREKVLCKKINEQYEKEMYKPMTTIHPKTNKLSMLYHPNFVKKLHGVTQSEEKLLIDYYNDSFNLHVYHHHWNKDDILIIDQNTVIHSRDPFVGERELWRISGWFK